MRASSGKSSSKFLEKEDEYIRLNAELEAKTADLLRDAEEVMQQQQILLDSPVHIPSSSISLAEASVYHSSDEEPKEKSIASYISSKTEKKKKVSTKSGKKIVTSESDYVALPAEYSLGGTISKLEAKADSLPVEDVLPEVASELGTDATMRFLKAKLRVLMEELDRAASENAKKDDELAKLHNRLKEVEEEKCRYQRASQHQLSQIDKLKHNAEEARRKSETKESQLSSLQRELDGLKREHKQTISSGNATEVRLNRAVEDLQRYKSQLDRANQRNKDSADGDKRRLEQALANNKRLEKQKQDLIAGFKKQMRLIDLLKRQRMHIEAAKMLQFTEEEFVRALDLGS